MTKMICDILGHAFLIAAVIVAGMKFAREWQRLSDLSARSDTSDIGGGHGF